ncbi:MAG: hypothetical protein R3F07_06805 [Opitutaceae bacterium]
MGNNRLTGLAGMLVSVLVASFAQGQETSVYELLAEYERPGGQPLGPLVHHGNGLFYGTTVSGGTWDRGTVFQISADGSRTTLHSFSLADGAAPVAGLVEAADGSLFGTTSEGGAGGYGTVFRISPAGAFSMLVDFTGVGGSAPGSVPGGLVLHPNGFLYGTTAAGGAGGSGTVFRLSPSGTLTTLVAFTGNAGARPGTDPQGPLTVRNGDLFGATRTGGAGGSGTLFRISTGGAYTLLREFAGSDGSRPAGGLLLQPDGLLSGTTEYGGNNGVGVAFRVDPASPGSFSVLHQFSDVTGSQPVGTLASGGAGTLYGAVSVGGADGLGGIFKLAQNGTYQLLFSFSGLDGPFPGASPQCGLVEAGTADFLGAASAGGPGQRGMIFRIDANDAYQAVGDLSPAEGWAPSGGPVRAGDGSVVFPMAQGGANGVGLIASIASDGSVHALQSLSAGSGGWPNGSLAALAAGWLGVTQRGGAVDRGTVVLIGPSDPPQALASFNSSSGEELRGPLTADQSGFFYGVAESLGFGGHGAVFRVALDGVVERLFTFTGTSGARPGSRPKAPLAAGPDGSLYGVTEAGGIADQGVLFKIATDGSYSVVAEFDTTGPRRPRGGLTVAGNGLIYGTTSLGGPADAGTVFELASENGTWTVRAAFTGLSGEVPGTNPIGPLALGASGRLYGMTVEGPGGAGTAFALSPGGALRSLVSFSGISGPYPGVTRSVPEAQIEWVGGLCEGPDGLIYGVTPAGGALGGGVVFRIGTALTFASWKLSMLGDSAAPDLGDPDHDGLSNLLEYALQRSPTVPDSNLLVPETRRESDGTWMSLSLTRDPARSDITVAVESAPSPAGPWNTVATSIAGGAFSGPGRVDETPASSGVWMTIIRDIIPSAPGAPRFMRVRASY